ncbi:uncharacterized protein Z518_00666 [Rhinocladiella mackenziei CBS 650.93]|uniref:Rhinocladiella mackenziei CBS 650.93 unplaced genomic scaffold supercont1.1, whole genome shotgun sequence n=1 Tax=Rhinocladiella mackenziei CBS 650.93 TaxID=1442369 RepID=A0A0D2J1N3_9EURO|nr:uncharacterized protein Z518_00666 [Rhinocladiella mackenziei CBS 650.93]KIX09586.1 hypothetical protein Z518_00666 [Rhinocladiella mackenziei CBS 650.93]
MFAHTVAYTIPVNVDGEPALTAQDVWKGILAITRRPQDFAEYMADSIVISGDDKRFRRKLVLASDSVHSSAGAELLQDVALYEPCMMDGTLVSTGAKTSMGVSYGGQPGEGEAHLYLTATYELRMPDVDPASEKAEKSRQEYANLARTMVNSSIESMRKLKKENRLDEYV